MNNEILEHVMRITPHPQMDLALATLNRYGVVPSLGILSDLLQPECLTPGTPLKSAVTGECVVPAWRELCPPKPDSAWEYLEFLRIVNGTNPTGDPETEWWVLNSADQLTAVCADTEDAPRQNMRRNPGH